MQCKHRMTYEIAWSGQPQETRVVFSGITMLWEYLVFLYNSELFHFVLLTCLQFGWEPRLLLSNYIYEEIWDVLMRKSEMSNTQFRIFFFLLVPFPLSMSCPFSLGVLAGFILRIICTVCIFIEFKNCFHYPLRPKKVHFLCDKFVSTQYWKQSSIKS